MSSGGYIIWPEQPSLGLGETYGKLSNEYFYSAIKSDKPIVLSADLLQTVYVKNVMIFQVNDSLAGIILSEIGTAQLTIDPSDEGVVKYNVILLNV